MARPTTSNALYIQCIGRVLRPFPAGGKTSALVLDVVGATEKNTLVSLVDLNAKEDRLISYDANPDREPKLRDPLAPDHGDDLEDIEGEIVATDVELFDNSDSVWLQTSGGLWFVPTKTAYFYLWPKPDGLFGLGRKDMTSKPYQHGQPLENDLTLEIGMAWAEKYAIEEEGGQSSISDRKAAWRKRKPSEAMVCLASALSIPAGELRQGELSDLITIAKASRTLPVAPTIS